MSACKHPKESRSLLSGYDVVCDACETIIGRVALFPCAVIPRPEAAAILAGLTQPQGSLERMARSRLEAAVRT